MYQCFILKSENKVFNRKCEFYILLRSNLIGVQLKILNDGHMTYINVVKSVIIKTVIG